MRVLVCGGRDYTDSKEIAETLARILPPYVELICGMARGADMTAYEWARQRQLPIHCFPADWTKHGKAAGPIRNQQMIDEGKPQAVVAFPGGRGTEDMIRRAMKAGIEVYRVA